MSERVINTKVSESSFRLLQIIKKTSGVTTYNLLQTVIEAYIRYFSSETVITEDLKRVISCFGRFKLTKKQFVLSEPNSTRWKLSRCIAFIKKEGLSKFDDHEEAVLIRAPREGEKDFIMNRNNDDILKAVLQSLDPDVLRNLQTVKKDNGLPSLLDALRFASSETANDQTDIFEREINELFSDNERSEYGTKPHEGTPYKRKLNRNIDSVFNDSGNAPDPSEDEPTDGETPRRRGRPRKNEVTIPEADIDQEETTFVPDPSELDLQDIEENEEPDPDIQEEGDIEEDETDRYEYASIYDY